MEGSMNISITGRHFRLRENLKKYAIDAAEKLDKFFDGIIRCDIILFETKPKGSGRAVEITLHVNGSDMTARATSSDYFKSVDASVQKLERHLKRYKEKIRLKDKSFVRRARSKV